MPGSNQRCSVIEVHVPSVHAQATTRSSGLICQNQSLSAAKIKEAELPQLALHKSSEMGIALFEILLQTDTPGLKRCEAKRVFGPPKRTGTEGRSILQQRPETTKRPAGRADTAKASSGL